VLTIDISQNIQSSSLAIFESLALGSTPILQTVVFYAGAAIEIPLQSYMSNNGKMGLQLLHRKRKSSKRTI